MTTLILSIICILFAIATCALAYLLKRSRTCGAESSNKFSRSTKKAVRQKLKSIGAQTIEEDREAFYFGFQGGNFILLYDEDSDSNDLFFSRFNQFPYSDYLPAFVAANDINCNSYYWTSFLKESAPGDSDPSVSISLRCRLFSWTSMTPDELESILKEAFFIARCFSEAFEKEKKKNYNTEFLGKDFANKVAFLQNREERSHGTVEELIHADENPFTIAAILSLYDGIDFGCIQSMQFLADNQHSVVTETAKITGFNIRDYIKENPTISELIFCLRFEKGGLIISLCKMDGCTEKSLFYRLSTARTGGVYQEKATTILTKRSLIEIRLSQDNEDYHEAKFMIEEAFDLLSSKSFDQLTNEQKAVVALSIPSMQTDIYWGMKYFNASCYYQALYYFNRILERFKSTPWDKLGDEDKKFYLHLRYHIGFIYMELHCTERAYYYLESATETNDIAQLTEYINCLCNQNDPRALDCIRHYINQVTEAISKNEDEENEGLIDFRSFLMRRLCYALIEQKDYDAAEKLLNAMIENGESVDFANRELEYIKSIRNADNPDSTTKG